MGREPGHMQGRSVHDSAVVDGAKFDVAVAFPQMWANLTLFVGGHSQSNLAVEADSYRSLLASDDEYIGLLF